MVTLKKSLKSWGGVAEERIMSETKMVPMEARNAAEAKVELTALSLEMPGMYLTPVVCFGLFYSASKRLHVNAPTDEPPGWRWYVLNGKVKGFTEAQVIADELATPTLS